MSHNLPGIEDNNEDILPPEKRIQQLLLLSSKIELNTNIAARKYDFIINTTENLHSIKYNNLTLL